MTIGQLHGTELRLKKHYLIYVPIIITVLLYFSYYDNNEIYNHALTSRATQNIISATKYMIRPNILLYYLYRDRAQLAIH